MSVVIRSASFYCFEYEYIESDKPVPCLLSLTPINPTGKKEIRRIIEWLVKKKVRLTPGTVKKFTTELSTRNFAECLMMLCDLEFEQRETSQVMTIGGKTTLVEQFTSKNIRLVTQKIVTIPEVLEYIYRWRNPVELCIGGDGLAHEKITVNSIKTLVKNIVNSRV